MPPRVVTASAVRIWPYTIHGWRPTSVTIHPASSAMNAAGPATAAARRNQRPSGTPDGRVATTRSAPTARARGTRTRSPPSAGTPGAPASSFGRSCGGTSFSPGHDRVRLAVREPRQRRRGSRCPGSSPRGQGSGMPPIVSGASAVVSQSPSIAASFIGCRSATSLRGQVAHEDLHGRKHQPEHEPHRQTAPVIEVAPPLQHADRVDRRDREARSPCSAARIMCVVMTGVEGFSIARIGCTSTTWPFAESSNPTGDCIHAFAVTTNHALAAPPRRDRPAGAPVRPRRQPVPSVEVDARGRSPR